MKLLLRSDSTCDLVAIKINYLAYKFSVDDLLMNWGYIVLSL